MSYVRCRNPRRLCRTRSSSGKTRTGHRFGADSARSAWKRFYNAHTRERSNLPTRLWAAWSKLAESAARLALVVHCVRWAVVHCVRWAMEDASLEDAGVVDAASLAAGIELAEWFKAETRRIDSVLRESAEEGVRQRLIEWVDRKGGTVTVREVQQGHRRYATAAQAKAVLDELVEAGLGRWEQSPGGRRGQPTRRFVSVYSSDASVYGNSADPGENRIL